MCGIAGIFHPDVPKPVDPDRVAAMTDRLTHRGPDGSGVWTAPGIGLGHRRLSIIDLSDAAAQPMLSADRRVAISFNGEIYNFEALRSELEAKGHGFDSRSDTEVVLAAWRQWGPECLGRLHGMFALAVYDASTDTLMLARDRLGVKPLFYSILSDGALIFASELKGLLAHPRLRRSPNVQAVEDYLAYGYVPDDSSIVEGVQKLPAGHFLLVKRGKAVGRPTSWWDVDFTTTDRRPLKTLQAEMVERLREAVESRMVADVPLGAFLSGGVDSSAVVAFMAEKDRQAVRTCSIGFDESDHDESAFAAQVAELFATDHRQRRVSAEDFTLIDRLTEAFDEPFADGSALSTLRLCELARENVKVALSGDGADEAMAGYRRYRLFAAEEKIRHWLPGPIAKAAGRLGDIYPKLDWAPRALRARTTLQAIGRSSAEAYAMAVGVTPSSTRSMLYTPRFKRDLGGHRAEDLYVKAFEGAPAKDGLSRAQYADLKIWLPGDILTKVDRTSMAVGLEAREPLLDHRFVQFCATLPPSMRLRAGKGKWLMKRALEDRLPREILYRPKMGFVTPISHWFRGSLAEHARSIGRASSLSETGWFDGALIGRLAEDHRRGASDHGRLLWQLVMLDRSLNHLFGLGHDRGDRSMSQKGPAQRLAV